MYNDAMARRAPRTNPFRYGDLALDRTFTDRADELKELRSDMRNGQNVVVFAPRRYGKSSLIWRAAQELIRGDEVLVAQVDLMKAPTKERLAEKLAASIYEDIASPLLKIRDRAAGVFRGLRIAPTISLNSDGSLGFSFSAGHSPRTSTARSSICSNCQRNSEPSATGESPSCSTSSRRSPPSTRSLLPLLRSVFQEQPDVAHVYLGSKRHMMERIFNDENEPFWRSAKQMELGVIPPPAFARFIRSRFEQTSRSVEDAVVDAMLDTTHSHPYGTQELAYALWEVTARGRDRNPQPLQRGTGASASFGERSFQRPVGARAQSAEADAGGAGSRSRSARTQCRLPATAQPARAINRSACAASPRR